MVSVHELGAVPPSDKCNVVTGICGPRMERGGSDGRGWTGDPGFDV